MCNIQVHSGVSHNMVPGLVYAYVTAAKRIPRIGYKTSDNVICHNKMPRERNLALPLLLWW